jgi:hypothetical protein
MKPNFYAELEVEDASTHTRFINMIGDISQTLYLANHPEESDDILVQLAIVSDTTVYPELYTPSHTRLQEAYA